MLLTRRRFIASGAASLALLALGCLPSGRASVTEYLSPPQPSSNMSYTEWKTWCVGRSLIDLPAGAAVKYLTEIDGDKLEKLPGVTVEQAQEMARKRVAELKSQPHKTQGTMYRGSYVLPGGGVYIDQWVDPKRTFLSKSEVYLVSQEPHRKILMYSTETEPSNWKDALQWYIEMSNALRSLEPGEIPTVPGFCGDGFLLLDTPSKREELAEIEVSLPGYPPGLKFYFTAATSTPSRTALADDPDVMREGGINLGGSERELRSYDTLRSAPHRVGPIKAYEICVAGTTIYSATRMYSFYWQTPGKPYDYAMPIMEASLLYTWSTNDYQQNTAGAFFSDEEALGLWDAIINSIRLRPGAA